MVLGYAIILLLVIIAIYVIYNQTLALSKEDQGRNLSQQKVFLISNTLAKLYEAEGMGIAYLQTVPDQTFDTYLRLMKEVRQNMDTLRKLVSSPHQRNRIDTVSRLLTQKTQNLNALLELRATSSPNMYRRTMERIEHMVDSLPSDVNVKKSRIVTKDSTIITPPKRGFLRRIFVRKEEPEVHVTISEKEIVDTLNQRLTLPSDTVLSTIRHAWDEYEVEQLQRREEVIQKELVFIKSGQHITEQIKQILGELEEEELSDTLARMEERQRVASQLTSTLAWIAIIACSLTFLFILLIFNDITKSQKYRKALEEANRYAEKLLQSREKLMLTVTHDIKSPLNSVTGYVELLRLTSLTERQHYYLQNMKSSADHILNLVNCLLDFSKLEAGKMEVEMVPYNPGKLLLETVESFIPLAAQKELLFKHHISNELYADYWGDPIKIRQIVINLLSNAIKYTREGSVVLSAMASTDTPETLEITITDTGSGMTPEEQKLIFEEFTRLSAQHNDGAVGTGLGLTITNQLVLLLEGRLSLESEKGAGSTFRVELPLNNTVSEEATEKTPPPPSRASLSALLVDDDPLQLSLSSEFLRPKGITCTTCEKSSEALSILENNLFDILLTDIQMPEIDGFELLSWIRNSENDTTRRLPVIALSARDDKKEADYIQMGFSAYLNKPYAPGQLLACISRLTGFVYTSNETTAAPSEEPSSAAYDLRDILVFADNDPEALHGILSSFKTDCHTHFQQLKEYLARKEYEKIGHLAHKMLPMFRQLHINALIPPLLLLERTPPADLTEEQATSTIQTILTEGEKIMEEICEP